VKPTLEDNLERPPSGGLLVCGVSLTYGLADAL
jgi:hypothetical protein